MNERVAKVGNWVLFIFSAPWGVVFGWGIVLLGLVLFFARKPRFAPYGVLTAEWRLWWARRWKYSTTFGRAIIYHPFSADRTPGVIDSKTEKHEMIHVRQVEDNMILSFLVGLVVGFVTSNWVLAGGLWMSGGLWQVPSFLAALLRGGHVYRDAEHERSAYAQCSETYGDGVSWLDQHLSKPRDW